MPTDLPERRRTVSAGAWTLFALCVGFLVFVGFLLGLLAARDGFRLQAPIVRDAPATQR